MIYTLDIANVFEHKKYAILLPLRTNLKVVICNVLIVYNIPISFIFINGIMPKEKSFPFSLKCLQLLIDKLVKRSMNMSIGQ